METKTLDFQITLRSLTQMTVKVLATNILLYPVNEISCDHSKLFPRS